MYINLYKVIWSGPAIRSVVEIIDYIKKESRNPEIAKRLGEEIINKADKLAYSPLRGRIVPEFQYIVEILAVIHEAGLLNDEINETNPVF